MNILYIIGNGFDLNLGLKTSYKDFYEYYKSVESSKQGIINLKNNISNNYKNWSDLELAFGQYTEVFEDIGEQLANYLRLEEEKFNFTNVDKERFFEYLVRPENYLPVADMNKIRNFKNNYSNSSWNINIFTFNYTKVIEKIIGQNKNIELKYHIRDNNPVLLRAIEHIHGYVDNRMVLGVNDISQIKNKNFHQEIDVLEALVKEKCNTAIGHTVDNLFKTRIKEADFICLFGVSIGDTDNLWWELIGNRLKEKNIPIIIFTKGEEVISPRIGCKNNRTKRKMRDYFLKKAKLSNSNINRISEDIFIALDTEMFKEVIKK